MFCTTGRVLFEFFFSCFVLVLTLEFAFLSGLDECTRAGCLQELDLFWRLGLDDLCLNVC